MKKLLKSKPALIALAVCVLLLGIGGASGSDNQELKDQLAIAPVAIPLPLQRPALKLFRKRLPAPVIRCISQKPVRNITVTDAAI